MPISEYLANVRSLVGHRELCLPAVTAIIRNPSGAILFVKNTGDSVWTFPGGLIEPAESPAQAVVREIREELSVNLPIKSLLGTFSGPEYRVTYPNGDKVVYVTSVFELFTDSKQLIPDGLEIEAAEFINASTVETLVVPLWMKDIMDKIEAEIRY